jgi:primosomal protein N' (replication factor Y)
VRYARVALPVPLGQTFTYLLPAALGVDRGWRVLVELGRRKVLGVVVGVSEEPPADVPVAKLKPIVAPVGSEPVLELELLDFLLELARYYLAPVGEVLRLALPTLERSLAERLEEAAGKKLDAVGKLVQVVSLAPAAADPPAEALRGQAAAILEHLRSHGDTALSELGRTFGNARSAVKKLSGLGLVAVERRPAEVDPFFAEPAQRDTPPPLNDAQRRAVERIGAALEHAPRAFLLDGVTASGKTEVYLHAAQRCLELGGGAILLVPEIALTPQLVARFRARLGDSIAVLHSGLTETARLAMWRALRTGQLRVVIGARSALFAPVRDLRLLCVDEEHDGSFKQEEGVRYNARDMALLRAHRAGAVCVLGSATPALTSEAAVRAGRLERLELPARARADARLPAVEIVDLRRFGAGPSGNALLSLPLHRALEETLAAGDQAILFLNRRGFAPSLQCEACGVIVECPHCSVALTLHRARGVRLECHYCDYQVGVPDLCPACKGNRLVEEGVGTERIETVLAEQFPSARIARLDRDVASGAKSEAILDRMRRREVDILVGTQMVTKGHDLPQVTLVGVINADAALSLPDFRAAERTFHLLVQVAGRAGRADKAGRVLIQTRQPDHPAVQLAASHDVRGFIAQEMVARQELRYPPYARIALVRLDAVEESRVIREAERLAELARRAIGRSAEGQGTPAVEVLGPAPAPLARLRNRYRYRFMLRCQERAALRGPLLALARAPTDRRVRVSIDVDPLGML